MNQFIRKFISNEKYEKLTPYLRWIGYVINRYVLVGLVFVVWMIFFDQNSFITHRELDKQIRDLEMDETYFSENLKHENAKLKMLQENPAEIERIAREKFYLKKDNEDIFIIQQEVRKQPQQAKNE